MREEDVIWGTGTNDTKAEITDKEGLRGKKEVCRKRCKWKEVNGIYGHGKRVNR